jgi:membrane AbrB-like protein
VIRPATPAAQWIALLVASAAVGAALQALRIPAALLLGPMLAAIAVAAAGGRARVPEWAFLMAQGLIGCLIAKMAPLSIAGEMLSRWPIFVFGVLAVIAVSTFLGWLLTRMHVLPGTAVLWGSIPGGATAMIVLAEAHGADARLVAFMQYLRVAAVAAGASIVAHLWNLDLTDSPVEITWFPPVAWLPLVETLALAILGPLLAYKLNIRSCAFLLPLVAGMLLSHQRWLTIELPPAGSV